LPEVPLRQWVLTFPFSWRRRLAHDGELLGALTRLFVETKHRTCQEGVCMTFSDCNSKPSGW